MIKQIIKEIIFTMIIFIILLLLLSILLYNYMPTSKIIPEITAYKTPTEIADEIDNAENTGLQSEILTYEITKNDLNLYTNKNIYVQGKNDPFAEVSEKSTSSNYEIPSGSSTQTNNSSNNINTVLNSTKTQTTK